MKYTKREATTFNSVIQDYCKIDRDSELEKRKLEYTDYKNLGFILDSLRYEKEASVSSGRIANWLKSFGCTVNLCGDKYVVKL